MRIAFISLVSVFCILFSSLSVFAFSLDIEESSSVSYDSVSSEESEVEKPSVEDFAVFSVNDPILFSNSYYVNVHISDHYLSGDYTLYIPVDRAEFFGLNSNNELVNLSFESTVCYLQSGDPDVPYNYRVTFSSFGTGTYIRRYYSGTRYYTESRDISCVVLDSNISTLLSTSQKPLYSMSDLLPYVLILLLGGLFVCFLIRSRS